MKLFWPYLYVPSETATYFMIAHPYGAWKITWTLFYQILGSIGVGTMGWVLWWCWRRRQRQGRPTQGNDTKSALHENLAKKGENSYYYAHRGRHAMECETDPKATRRSITRYSWTEGAKTIQIYVETQPEQDQIDLEWTSSSLLLTWPLKADLLTETTATPEETEVVECLAIPSLFASITDATWKRKKKTDTIVLTLKKQDPNIKWKSLHAAAQSYEDNVVYDKSLYD